LTTFYVRQWQRVAREADPEVYQMFKKQILLEYIDKVYFPIQYAQQR